MTKEELIKLSRENLRKSKQGSLCECYDEAFIKGYELSEKQIADLEKENAELKKQLEMSNKVYNDNLDYSHHIEGQLTTAKEKIGNLLEIIKRPYQFNAPKKTQMVNEAEQFLNSEVEK